MSKSKISNLSYEDTKKLVNDSKCLSDILRKLSLHTSSGNFRTLKRKLKKENINYEHIVTEKSKIGTFRSKIELEDILTENSIYTNPNLLKRRLIKDGFLQLTCQECGIGPSWNNKNLCLQLDHINGVSDDNRLENLRLLCPNCHSQTNTYAARNKTKK